MDCTLLRYRAVCAATARLIGTSTNEVVNLTLGLLYEVSIQVDIYELF